MGLFRKTVIKPHILPEVKNAEFLHTASAVKIKDSENLDQIINNLKGRIRTKINIRHDNSHIETFRSSSISFQPQFFSLQPQSQDFQNQNFENQG